MQVSGLPTWAAGSAKAMELMILPPEVRRVNIAADGDPPGRRAAEVAAARWMREGRMVRIYRAPDGLDFNDLLLREAASCAQS
jgi:DNA primase